MSDKVEYSRLLLKRTNTAGVVPTIPPVSATTLNQFTPTDLFVGEMFANVEDDRLWIRTNTGLVELNTSGTTGSTVIPDLTQVLNSGNTTGGFDIIFPSGSTTIYEGLNSGSTVQYLGLGAGGRVIIATGTTGGSGTSGTSGTNGTSGTDGSAGTSGVNGTSGTNGSAGTSGVNGTSGTSGISGLGLFLPLSGGTVTGNTTFTQNVYLTNLTSGGSSTYLTVDSDTGQIYTAQGTNGTSGTSGTNGSSGVNGTSGTSGVGTSGTSGLSGVNGTSGTSGVAFSGGSGNCITDLFVTNIHGCSPINVIDDIIFSGDVFIKNITSGGSSTYLTIDSDTGQLYTAQGGASGTSGTSGVNGTSGTSGTGGGGGGTNSGSHFNYTTAPGRSYSLTQTGWYQEVGDLTPFEQWIVAYPMTPGRNLTISAMTCDFYRTYSQTDGRIKFLIYDNNASQYLPGNLLSESASITTQQFTILQYNIDYTFSAGTTYWLAMAFNDKMDGTGGNAGMRGNPPRGMLTIGTPTFSDGYGLMWKAAVSATDASLTIPSTWTKPSVITAFYGSYLWPDEGAYYGGDSVLPEIRLKPKLV